MVYLGVESLNDTIRDLIVLVEMLGQKVYIARETGEEKSKPGKRCQIAWPPPNAA